jgi:hypothetical protein
MKKSLLGILLLSILAIPALAVCVAFTSPAGGETFVRGSMHCITYTVTLTLPPNRIVLKRDGVLVGNIIPHNHSVPPGVMKVTWDMGMVFDNNGTDIIAPYGGGYTICCVDYVNMENSFGCSNSFSIGPEKIDFPGINKIQYSWLPRPGDCPQCLILDLAELRQELVKLDVDAAVGLFLKGGLAADLGKIGKGQVFAPRLQVKLSPEALAAMKRGEEFELRLLGGRNRLIHVQAVRLVLAGR